MTTKRRLQLLPEVLPKPERGPQTPSSVRARTLARLSVLAALTATACGGKGDGGYGVVDPLPSPTGGSGGSGGTGGLGGLGGGGTAGSAYGVVDPLPIPVNCPSPEVFAYYADWPDAGASGATVSDAGAVLNAGPRPLDAGTVGTDPAPGTPRRVSLFLTTSADGFGSAIPQGGGVQVLQQSDDPNPLRQAIQLLISVEVAELSISVACGGLRRQMNIQLTLHPTTIDVEVSPGAYL